MLQQSCSCGCMKVKGLICRSMRFPSDLCNSVNKGSQVMNQLIIKNDSITIDSLKEAIIDITDKNVIVITCCKCNQSFRVMEKRGHCFLYIERCVRKASRRHSYDFLEANRYNKFIKNYVVTNSTDNDQNSEVDDFDDYDQDGDFDLMFSNDKEPFVGSYVDHFLL